MQYTVNGLSNTGITSSNNVNSGLELGNLDDPKEIEKYSMDYQNIVNNEIGHDNIKS